MCRTAILALLTASAVHAQAPAEEPVPPRLKIGLALGGGGARGGAHVGVLQVLEELHVPVDAIAGTSMGSMIGGIYAAGVPIARIEQTLRGADWAHLLDDRPPYRELVYRRKEDASRYLVDFELGIHEGKLRQPRGLRAGQKLAFEARVLLLGTARQTDFSKLPTSFCAVATDVETGDRVILDHGDLVEAMLASLAVPGAFAPVEIDGRLLVDGGIVDNTPVDLARAQGADVVIAIDVGTPLVDREKLGSMFAVLGQTTTFLTRKNSMASLAGADLVISPELSDITSGEFVAIPEAITRGRGAALAATAELQRYSLDDDAWQAYIARRNAHAIAPLTIGSIRVEGNSNVDTRLILGRMHTEAGDPVDADVLRQDLVRIYGLDYFQRVTMDIVPGEDGNTLVLRVAEKTWGPTYIRFGLEALDDLEGDARYGVRSSITRTLMNRRGLEWRTDFQLGSTQLVRSELYQPIDFSGLFFVAPWVQGQREKQPVYVDGQRIADYDVATLGGGLDFGMQFGSLGELRLGVLRSTVVADVTTGSPTLPDFTVDTGALSLRLVLTTLDRPAIPTHGGELRAGLELSRRGLGAEADYDRAFAGASRFFGRSRHTGFVAVEGGSDLGTSSPSYDQFTLGGLFSLGGYAEGELRGPYYAYAALGYHYRIAALPAGFGHGVYVGTILEAGNVWDDSDEISASDLHYGATVVIGADTILGPVFLGFAQAEGGHNRAYLTVGATF